MFSSLELLESRIAPAGIITLDANSLGYVLSGDAAANELEITQDGNQITLTPQDGTQILNRFAGQTVPSSDPVTISLTGDRLAIDMGEGADVLTLGRLTLPSDLIINMGAGSSADELTIADSLWVGGDLSIVIDAGTASIGGDYVHVAYDVDILSFAQSFTTNVGSFYVGDDLYVDAILTEPTTDVFTLSAANFFVYDDFDLIANGWGDDPVTGTVRVDVTNTLSVGGNLQVMTDGIGHGNVLIVSNTMVLSEKVIVKNESGGMNKELSVRFEASVIRVDGGLSLTSKSSSLSDVSIAGDLVIIDGPVSAKLPKSAGGLSIEAEQTLLINGNVKFASKGAGILDFRGGGDIFGKVTASLGSGTGKVAITGSSDKPLLFDGLNVKAPGKNVPSSGIEVLLADVSVFGKVSLKLGRGVDLVDIKDGVFRGAVSISTGDGNDIVNLHTDGNSFSELRNGLSVSLGRGDDELTLGRPEAFAQNTALLVYSPKGITGGAGTDAPFAEGRNVKFFKSFSKRQEITPVFRSFERA